MTRYRSSDNGIVIGLIAIWGIVFLAAAYGYIMNVVKLFEVVNDPLTGMEIARGIGVFALPLGAILGFL